MAAARDAPSPPPTPVIARAGRYTVFITPPSTHKTSEPSRTYIPSPSPSPRPTPTSRLSSSPRNATPVAPPPVPSPSQPPVQVPPPQFEKPRASGSSVFGFFWNAVARVQDAHSSLDEYLADWFGLNQSKYQWALNDYYENKGEGFSQRERERERDVTCNACNKEFEDDVEQKLHYRSEWHRYNLKRKVAGVPGVTEALFQARQSALAQEQNKHDATPMLYGCALCGKEYRSLKAHEQHLKSRNHVMKASQGSAPSTAGITIIKPAKDRVPSKPASSSKLTTSKDDESEESEEDEWLEVADLDATSEALTVLHVNGDASGPGLDHHDNMDEDEELDPSSCFICDLKHKNIESCMVHMHKQHGFFIPDIEYLKDPEGLLTYVGLKVMRDFMCLYCNEKCHAFQSLEAVRKHMIAKGHCKLRYGEGGDDEDAELEDFYDYSTSYVDEDGKQLMALDDTISNIELGGGGAELVINRKTSSGISTRTLGSREYLRYYRQKPRPSPARNVALAVSLASRYRSMGLATVQSRAQIVRMKVLREMNRKGVDFMRSKMGMKSNVIRNLPNNVTY